MKFGDNLKQIRKHKKISQEELAEKLRVSRQTISKWETGRNMPDLSLFKPLCNELNITINDLMSGEKIEKEEYQEKFEENIVNTIDYSTKRLKKYSGVISLIFIVFGLFISLSAIMIFPSESSWGSIYSVFGILVFMIGMSRISHGMKWNKRLIFLFLVFFGTMGILIFTDYVNVKQNEEAPMFRVKTTTTGSVIYYDTLFYDVYRCNFDEENEYWVIEKNKNVTVEELLNYCK